MEEEGTEIVLRPGTEDILTKHFSSKKRRGKKAQLNVLQYCTVEETVEENEEADLSEELPSTAEGGERTSSTSLSSPSIEEQGEESALIPAEPAEEPPSHPEVNRHDSLVEDDSADEDDESVSSDPDDSSDRFHPALKAAVNSEGQEAVWHEDEYSTISSIYVKPEKETQNSRMKMKVPFFKSRGKKAQMEKPVSEGVETTARPVKIHIKKKKIAKAVLLLPPKEANEENTNENRDDSENGRLDDENERNASITENSMQARRLLDTVLSGDYLDEEESERVTKEAFNHATAARRQLAQNGKTDESECDVANDNDSDKEAIELENIMSYLAEEGEKAALQHTRECKGNEKNGDQEEDDDGARYSNAIDLTKVGDDDSEKSKKKRRGKFPVSGYASRAVHYLESILPKNFGNAKGDGVAESPDNASNAEDFWSDAGISTLGLKNDTQEYELNTGEGDDANNNGDNNGATVLRNDMMSLSSLNEILDGGGKTGGKKGQLQNNDALKEGGEPSPRAAVQEIGIPKKKKIGLPPMPPRKKILGLITPKIAKTSTKNNKKEQVNENESNGNKTWNVFFKTPRASDDDVPNQLNLVLEKPKEDNSSAASDSGENKEGVESTSPNKSNPAEAENIVEGETDSYLDMPEDNRYTPALVDEGCKDKCGKTRAIPQDNEIELKLSVATNENQSSENTGSDGDESTSPEEEEEENKTGVVDDEAKKNVSIEHEESASLEDEDRYQVEPGGMTPKRDGLELEENTDRKESIPDENNDEDKAASKTITDSEGPPSDSIEASNPDSKPSLQDETKLSVEDKDEKVLTKENNKKVIAQAKIDVAALPTKSKTTLLVPLKVVEEKYFVDKDMKKISTGPHFIKETKKPTKMTTGSKQNAFEKDTKASVPASKDTVGQSAKESPKMETTTMDSSFTVISESTTVVQNAISNGNLKANESNEEGDDVVPTNYLSAMLRKKLSEEKAKIRNSEAPAVKVETIQQKASEEEPDVDSYVEKIRGPRRNKAPPGVAMKEIANDRNIRDPSIVNGINHSEDHTDLAPTPRRLKSKPSRFDDENNKQVEDEIRYIPMKEDEEERQRRKLITERLFQAGIPKLEDEKMPEKEAPEDVIKEVPTVLSAESYPDDPLQENVDNAEKVAHSRTAKLGRGRRILSISFLKAGKRK